MATFCVCVCVCVNSKKICSFLDFVELKLNEENQDIMCESAVQESGPFTHNYVIKYPRVQNV